MEVVEVSSAGPDRGCRHGSRSPAAWPPPGWSSGNSRGATALSHFRHQNAARRRSSATGPGFMEHVLDVMGQHQVPPLTRSQVGDSPTPCRQSACHRRPARRGRRWASPYRPPPAVPLQAHRLLETLEIDRRAPADVASQAAAHAPAAPPCRGGRWTTRRCRGSAGENLRELDRRCGNMFIHEILLTDGTCTPRTAHHHHGIGRYSPSSPGIRLTCVKRPKDTGSPIMCLFPSPSECSICSRILVSTDGSEPRTHSRVGDQLAGRCRREDHVLYAQPDFRRCMAKARPLTRTTPEQFACSSRRRGGQDPRPAITPPAPQWVSEPNGDTVISEVPEAISAAAQRNGSDLIWRPHGCCGLERRRLLGSRPRKVPDPQQDPGSRLSLIRLSQPLDSKAPASFDAGLAFDTASDQR